jgi:hypothetical protein
MVPESIRLKIKQTNMSIDNELPMQFAISIDKVLSYLKKNPFLTICEN